MSSLCQNTPGEQETSERSSNANPAFMNCMIDGVGLSLIIVKSAISLKLRGQPRLSVEYLEFVVANPLEVLYSKTLILALLAHSYEQSGCQRRLSLPGLYRELQRTLEQDMPEANQYLMHQLHCHSAGFSESSAVWEVLAQQALNRCEYVLAAEFLTQAIAKAPGKLILQQMLSEVYTVIKLTNPVQPHLEGCDLPFIPLPCQLVGSLLQIAPVPWSEALYWLIVVASSDSAGERAEPCEADSLFDDSVNAENNVTHALSISDEEQCAERVQVIKFMLTHLLQHILMCLFSIFCSAHQVLCAAAVGSSQYQR